MRKSLKHLLTTLLLGSLLLVVPLALAQTDATAETTAAAPGVNVGVFLIGCLAIIVVGVASLARDSFKSDDDKKS